MKSRLEKSSKHKGFEHKNVRGNEGKEKVMMGRQRTSSIERMLQRIEERIEQWRGEHQERFVDAEAGRSELWTEAAAREKLLSDAVYRGEAEGIPARNRKKRAPAVYVLHSSESTRQLENLAAGGASLASVLPGKHAHGRETELNGSWLVFEVDEDVEEESGE